MPISDAPAGPRRLIIAGAGIGGLAAALALARHGIATEILERRAAFAEAGAGIQIGPNGTRILDWLGVGEILRPQAAVPAAIEVMDARGEGQLLARLPLGDWIANRHGSPYWVVRREDLHMALRAKAAAEPLITLTMGAAVARAEDAGTHLAITAIDGRRWHAIGLVGADGVWSSVRSLVSDVDPPGFAGKAAARATLPIDQAPDYLGRRAVAVWMQPGAHVVHYPVCAGRELAVVVIGPDTNPVQDWSRPATAGWVAARTRSFPPRVAELLAAASDWHMAPLVELAPLARYNCGRVALLGDAAHPVLPYLAQGGVLALEDAVVLARAVAAVDGGIL